jgi:branched-chain amino acid transport system substrate-binding protein
MADTPEDETQDDGRRVDRRSVLKYGGSSAVVAGLAGCQSPQNPYPGSGLRGSDGNDSASGGLAGDNQGEGEQFLSGTTVRIGILAPMNLPLGQSMWEAAQLAAQQYNESGGMLGAKLEVSLGESNADPNQTVSEYNRLVRQENCDMTMGVFLGSALVRMMNQAMAPAGKIHITTASADPRAGQLVSKNVDFTGNGAENEYERFKYHFRAGPINLLDLADAMLEFLENQSEERGWGTVGVLTENPQEFTPYHERLTDGLSEIVDVPVVKRVSGGTKWRSVYNELESENCDLVLVGLALAGTKAVTQWANQRRPFAFGGIHVPAQSFGYWEATGGSCEYVFTMNAMTPQTTNTPLTQEFVQAYQEEYGKAPVYSGALTYDAINLVEQALRMTFEGEGTSGEVPDADTMVPYLEEGTFTDSTILEEFQFTPADSEYAHEPQWTSIEATGVPVFQQWQDDPETRPDYGTMHSFYPEQNKTADYAAPDWIGGGG